MQILTKLPLFLALHFFILGSAWADSIQSLMDKAREAESQGQYSSALIHLRNVVKDEPDSLTARLELARMFVFTGQGIQAQLELEKAQTLGAKPVDTALMMVKAQFYQGLYEDILDHSSLINLPQSQIAQIRAMQGFALFEQKKLEQARQMFERAISLSADVMETQLGQVKLYAMQQQQEKEIQLIERLLKIYPDHPEVLLVAGETYRTQSQFNKALALFEQAGRIQQSNINVWFGIVRTYIGLKDFNNAKAEIQKVLVSYPEHQVANYLLAVIAFEENDYTRAKSSIDIVLKGKKREYEALKLLGTIQFHQQDYTQAEKNLLKYLGLHSDDAQAVKTLASVYLKRRQGTRAIDILKPLESSNDPYVFSLLALAYEYIGNSEKSSDYIEKSFQLAPEDQAIKAQFQKAQIESGKELDITFKDTDYQSYLEGGHLPVLNLFRQKKFDEAMTIIQGYLNKQPQSGLLHYMLGSGYQYKGELEKAKSSFIQSIQLSESLMEPRVNLARIYVVEGDDREAERIFREVLKIKPQNDTALVALAGIYHRRGDDQEMLKWLNMSRKFNSASLASREVLEDYYRRNGNHDKALEITEEMVYIQPENTALLKKLADNQHNDGKTDLAVMTYQKIVSLKPDYAAAWYGLGRMQSLNGELKASQKSFEKVLELEPESLVARVVLIQLDLKFGKPDVALVKAQQLVRIHPDKSDSYDMLGDVHVRLKNYTEAVKNFEKSAGIKFSSEAYLKLLSVYNMQGQTEKGFKLLQQWVEKFPDAIPLSEVLALTYHQRGELDHARTLYEKIIKKEQNNDRILNSLALVALEQGSPMSLEYADLAYNINSKKPANMDTLGWVHVNNKNLAKGLTLLKQAVEAAPSNPDVRYHYAYALTESNNRTEAKKQLYLALAAEGKFINRSYAQKLLDKLNN